MQPVNRIALKEWAAVCEALAQGRQSILLRKGGLEEGSAGFQLQHEEFWLFPTRFHQDPAQLKPDAEPLLAAATVPPDGIVALRLYAVAEDVHQLTDPGQLAQLEPLHVLAPETVRERFHYRADGLNVITVRVFKQTTSFEISEAPHFAGCKSWVDLRNKLPTSGLQPVLSDPDYEVQCDAIRAALQ
ncbi:MAG: DUF1802 family protein [Planctomycetota bacterium]|nr:MAG: DUF1802 family protein [Planctomycetota bacterium]REK20712.1 MAG: DUF1802 family protein [Planctomycetota bacterium]REK38106.1 MAG: DUF1802 family protein [Planctomycetota bacterium]